MRRNFLNNGPLISVVIPAYNVEQYIERCLDSVLSQSYHNLEVIVVNDCSTDNTSEIIDKYIKNDSRVSVITHEINMGLFQARISGAQKSTGKYLAFIDSDDYISFDWYRKLVKKAESTGADIVVGEMCLTYENGVCQYNVEDPFRLQDFYFCGKEAINAFMEQEGRSYTWSVLGNKIFKKSLWKKCETSFVDFSKNHGHMLMWEDVAFSTGLWCNASLVVNEHNCLYYYYKSGNSATSLTNDSKRLEKYYHDSVSAIRFMKEELKRTDSYLYNEIHYLNWKNSWGCMVYRDISKSGNHKSLLGKVKSGFALDKVDLSAPKSLLNVFSPLGQNFNSYENIKKNITDPAIEYVSFDIFDTLIQRPFLQPTDLFYFLSDKFNEITSSYIDFKTIREEAERKCREELHYKHSKYEEIDLNQIYDNIKNRYLFDLKALDEIKNYEIHLEEYFCQEREIGKELYNLALDAGKKIIICSDMYLPLDVIERILERAGYLGYEKIYLSSQYKLTKRSTNLYKYIIKDLNIKNPKSILHIGDNYDLDVEKPNLCGITSCHVGKASDVLKGALKKNFNGCLYSDLFFTNPDRVDFQSSIMNFPALRDIWGLVANKIFGNPFVSFHPDSAFNANPNYIGYAALGPHLLAVAQWILKIAQERNIPEIHFVARDGYLVKKAFDLINTTNIRSNYIRVSRKAMILADIENISDLYSINTKINIYKMTPKQLQEYLLPIIPEKRINLIEKTMEEEGLLFNREMGTIEVFLRCMKVYIERFVEIALLKDHKEKLKKYFGSMIHDNDYIFDIGYSGRTETALSNILGFPVGSLYIHVNSDIAILRQNKYKCPCECFYQYKPSITGLIREHLFMELGPSTIGYQINGDEITPIFEKYEIDYDSRRITQGIQQAALNFIMDYMNNYHDHTKNMFCQSEIMSGAYEYYLHYSREFDRAVFLMLPFEDDINGTNITSALDFWNKDIINHNLSQKGGANRRINDIWYEDIFPDGIYIKFYRWLNKKFPRGNKQRELIKKIVRLFVR